jgi:hypothetical protein
MSSTMVLDEDEAAGWDDGRPDIVMLDRYDNSLPQWTPACWRSSDAPAMPVLV